MYFFINGHDNIYTRSSFVHYPTVRVRKISCRGRPAGGLRQPLESKTRNKAEFAFNELFFWKKTTALTVCLVTITSFVVLESCFSSFSMCQGRMIACMFPSFQVKILLSIYQRFGRIDVLWPFETVNWIITGTHKLVLDLHKFLRDDPSLFSSHLSRFPLVR